MNKDILQFVGFLGKLKHIPRTGWVLRGVPNPETIACHMYRMAVLAFMLDDKKVDRCKCIKMALVHDMAESIVGDLTPHCGVNNEEKFRRENDAIRYLASLVPDAVGDEFVSLWCEYEAGTSPEAIAVKDLDRFDMIAQAKEYEDSMGKPGSLEEFFASTAGKFKDSTVTEWVDKLRDSRSSHHSSD